MNTSRIVYIVIFALVAIFSVIAFQQFGSYSGDFNDKMGGTIGYNGINLVAILLGLTILCVLAFSLVNIISKPKAAMKLGIILVGFLIVLFIAYGISGNELPREYVNKDVTTAGSSKWIGAVLLCTGIMGAIAILSAVVSEIMNVFK